MDQRGWFGAFAEAVHAKNLQRILGIDAFALDEQLAALAGAGEAEPQPSEGFADYVERLASLLANSFDRPRQQALPCAGA